MLVDGVDVGLDQIRMGMAWHYKKYAHEKSSKDQRTYAETEEQARVAIRGLWRDGESVSPWEWRTLRR